MAGIRVGAVRMEKIRILVADDDPGLRLSVRSALSSVERYEIVEAFDGINAIEIAKDQRIDLALLDVDMPRMTGHEALKRIKEQNPGTVVIILTAFASLNNAVQAVRDGAYDYLAKPVQAQDLLGIVERAIAAQTLISNVAASAPVLMEEGRKFVGQTQQMQKVFGVIHRLSKVDTPVLIRGASGTGKELVARAIHFNSARKDGKFVAINCSAIPENLFESELFGHEKGSFTGADQRKIGKFQYAEGGTLFLDEVGDMPVLMQVKLLRVLQEKVFVPVGSNREIATNVRIIAATNRPLEDMMKAGTFREDLFYRLNVIPILLPSLADRREDLERLIHLFIGKFNQAHTRRITRIAPDALAALKKYNWPGNIRELENVIEHSFIMETSNCLNLCSLPETILSATGICLPPTLSAEDTQTGRSSNDSDESIDDEIDITSETEADSDSDDSDVTWRITANGDGNLDFNAQKEAFEKEFIIKALKTFGGRINQTALHANIPKKTLLRKIEKYGINARDFVS